MKLHRDAKTTSQSRRLLIRRNVWINPSWEDEVAEYMGTDRVLFGSDCPHVEGLPVPTHDLDAIRSHFSPADQRKILRDKGRSLNELAPA